jgi:hypothetical protein
MRNALGSRNANGRISWAQTRERIVAVGANDPNARLPTQIVMIKDVIWQQSQNFQISAKALITG